MPALATKGIETRRGVAEGPLPIWMTWESFFLLELAEEGCALEGAQLQLNAHDLQVVDGRLREVFVGDVAVELPASEAVRVPASVSSCAAFLGS
jgi:hypothetical protein